MLNVRVAPANGTSTALSLPTLSSTACSGQLRISALKVTFLVQPVEKHVGRTLRVVLNLGGSRMVSRKARPEVSGGLATASWGEEWDLEVPFGSTAVLRLELQAVGLFRSTTLAFMFVDLTKIPAEKALQRSVWFGFGQLTAWLQLQRLPTPMHPKPLLGRRRASVNNVVDTLSNIFA
eukprot:RCo042044